MQPYVGEPEVQGCGDDMEEEEGAEDVGLEAGVDNLGNVNEPPFVRNKEAWIGAEPEHPSRRPSLLSHLSHLSITSTETTEGTSSEGNTFSVNSQDSGPNLRLSTNSRSAPDDTAPDGTNQVTRSELKDGEEVFNNGSDSGTGGAPTSTHPPTSAYPPTSLSSLAHSILTPALSPPDTEPPLGAANIPRTPRDGKDPPSAQTKSDAKVVSPASDGSGTVFASNEGEPEKSIIAQPVGLDITALPPSVSTSIKNTRRHSEILELRPEDVIHDWKDEKEPEVYRHVYEHRKEIKERSRFRPPAVTPREVPDYLSFSTQFGSSHNRSTKGKERERLLADDFDLLQEDFSLSEGRFGRGKSLEQDRSPQSHTSSEHERAQFDAAIRAHQKSVHFQPRTIRPRNSAKAADSSSTKFPDRGQQHQAMSAQPPNSSTSQHSPHPLAHERKQSLNRRPSTKRAQSHVMSWDMALLSPAPQNDLVEENQPDRESKALGSARFAGDAALDLNIIEQAFTAAINTTDPSREVVVEGAIVLPINTAGEPQPSSPSAATVSSVSSTASRRQFTSYRGPSLPEIQASSTHAELFYLAFGNGGSSSRQSLTGSTVQKKRERAENDKADKELRATEKAERKERRQQPYNVDFEPPVTADATTESQSESVTEGYGTSVDNSGTSDHAEMETMSWDEAAADAEERRRIRGESRAKRREKQSRSPEPIISAAVIMPVTGKVILTKDGQLLSNDPEAQPATSQKLNTDMPVSETSSGSFVRGPKVQNTGETLRPHGTFTTARHPSMTIHTDAIRARALVTDERFDTINSDQLQAAADAGDQIAEAHLRQRQRRSRLLTSQELIPADAMKAERPLRKRHVKSEGSARRKSSSTDSAISTPPRKLTSPVMQTIQEDGVVNVASTNAERKISRDITSQVEQLESRRSSDSTNSSGRLSTASIGSAVEALIEAIGDKNVPINLPIKLSPLSARSKSLDQAAFDASTLQPSRSGSVPTTSLEFATSKRSPFISNTAISTSQELFNVPAFPPVASSYTPTSYAETTPARRSSSLFVTQQSNGPFSPTSESELFLDVARLTSRQVERERALNRAQDARDKGLATESVGNQRARADAAQRTRVRESVRKANAITDTNAPQEESDMISAMSSFGISYESSRRPSVDNSLDPLAPEESKDQRREAHQRRKRMRRKLEHDRVVRETPVAEYSNPFDSYLGGLQQEKKDVDQMSRVAEPICEEDEEEDTQNTTNDSAVLGATAADPASGEG